MTNHPLFKAYLALVCFLPALVIAALIAWLATGPVVPHDPRIFLAVAIGFVGFQLVGMLVLFIDLWRSELPSYQKLQWGSWLFLALAIVAPAYWVMKIRTRGQTGAPVEELETNTIPASEEMNQVIARLAARETYRSSGKIGAEFFFLATPLAVVAAIVTGSALFGLWAAGLYFIIIAPAIAATLLAGALVLGIRIGKCRNRTIAAVYGVLAGALMYGSYFYFDMIDTQGAAHALRLGAVPAHISLRLQTDGLEMHGRKDGPPNPWANYVVFAIGLAVICGVTSALAVSRAGKVYCEEADQWAACHTFQVPPGKGRHIMYALDTGLVDDSLAALCNVPLRVPPHHCELILESCKGSRDDDACCAYLSLKEYSPAGKTKGAGPPWEVLLKQCALAPDEFRKFKEKFLCPDVNAKRKVLSRQSLRAIAGAMLIVGAGVLLWKIDALREAARFGPAEELQAGQRVFWKVDARALDGATEVPISQIEFPSVVDEVMDDKVRLGRVWVKTKDVMLAERALRYYTNRALSWDDAASWECRGVIWIEKGNDSNAISDFDKAIRLDPNNAGTYLRRGMALENTGAFEAAMRDFDTAVILDPSNEFTLARRGDNLYARGEHLKAIEQYTEVIRRNPTNAAHYYRRANARSAGGQFDGALQDCDEAIRLDPRLSVAYCTRGVARKGMGENQRSMDDFDEAIRLDPNEATAYCNRGVGWLDAGAYAEALKDFTRAIQLKPAYVNAHNNLAWMYATCGEPEFRNGKMAVAHALRACNLTRWKEAFCVTTLAAAYAESDDFDSAVKWQENAITLTTDDHFTATLRARSEIYRKHEPYREIPGNR